MAYSDLTPAWLTGVEEPPLVEVSSGLRLHPDAAAAFLQLAAKAKTQGIELRLVSAWRGFAHQARIWQAKWRGERPVYDAQSSVVDLSTLSITEKAEAILLYSALPGTSRHHWGSDFDWYDAAAVPADYRPQLLPEEYQQGPFQHACEFIAAHAADVGFYAPYAAYQGGVAPEPWHLSFMPLARECTSQLTTALVHHALLHNELDDKAQLIALLPEIFQRFVQNVAAMPEPSQLAKG